MLLRRAVSVQLLYIFLQISSVLQYLQQRQSELMLYFCITLWIIRRVYLIFHCCYRGWFVQNPLKYFPQSALYVMLCYLVMFVRLDVILLLLRFLDKVTTQLSMWWYFTKFIHTSFLLSITTVKEWLRSPIEHGSHENSIRWTAGSSILEAIRSCRCTKNIWQIHTSCKSMFIFLNSAKIWMKFVWLSFYLEQLHQYSN